MQEQKDWENILRPKWREKRGKFKAFLNLFIFQPKAQREQLNTLFQAKRFDILYDLLESSNIMTKSQERLFYKGFQDYLAESGLSFINTRLSENKTISPVLLAKALFTDKYPNPLKNLKDTQPYLWQELQHQLKNEAFKNHVLNAYNEFLEDLINSSIKRPGGFKQNTAKEFATSRFTNDVDVSFYYLNYYARFIMFSSHCTMLTENAKINNLTAIKISTNVQKLSTCLQNEINEYGKRNNYINSEQLQQAILEIIVPDKNFDLAVRAIVKHMNDLMFLNKQQVVNNIMGKTQVLLQEQKMDLNDIPKEMPPVINHLDSLLSEIEKNIHVLDMLSQQEFKLIQEKHLPATLVKYFQMPLEFRQTMKNANGLSATDLTLETLKDFEKKLMYFQDEIATSLLREVSANHKHQKMR